MVISIPVQILDIDSDLVAYNMESGDNDAQKWISVETNEYSGADFRLEIEFNGELNDIRIIYRGKNIITPDDEIIRLFSEAMFEEEEKKRFDEHDGFEHFHNNVSLQNEKEPFPYDPKLIRVDTKPFSIEHICKLIKNKRIDISPNFQRNFVWTQPARKSRLIESILLRIPIPVFYLSQDESGAYQVIDGIQRLTVINDFINNKFRLTNLEYLKELEGMWFDRSDKGDQYRLPTTYSSRIEDTQLFFNIIDPSTPEQVKYDIFRRINTGGISLNNQEIRNCLSRETTRTLLHKMVSLDSFKNATNNSIKSTRMGDSELALRFIAFYIADNDLNPGFKYKGEMDEFLDQTISLLNKMPESIHKMLYENFDNAMSNAFILFDKSAFRRTAIINKALFLALSRHLYKYSPEVLTNAAKNINCAKALSEAIENNADFLYSITHGTNDLNNVEKAYTNVGKFLEGLGANIK